LSAIKIMVAAAEAEAAKRNVHVSLCIVDESGNLLFFEKAAVVPFVAFTVSALYAHVTSSGSVAAIWRRGLRLWVSTLAMTAAWVVVYLGVVLAIMIGAKMPWIDKEQLGAFAMNQFQSLLGAIQNSGQKSQGKEQQQQSSKSSDDSDDATVKAARSIARAWGHELTPDEKKWAGPLVHYTFGALAGGVYGAVTTSSPCLATAGAGTLFGAALWLAADEIGVPAAGLSGSPFDTPLPSHAQALASHLVFGVTTEGIRKLVSPKE